MPSRGVIRRDRKTHSNLRPKHKHTKHYLKHYWPYLPLVTLVLVGLWLVRPASLRPTAKEVLAKAVDVTPDSLLKETNEQREKNNLKPLKPDQKLQAAAEAKVHDMVARDYWSHNTPDGSPPWVFVVNSGYQYQKAGENLAYGFLSSDDAVEGWMNSPAHRANILDEDYVDVGFAAFNSNDFNHSGPSTVIVAMYGRSVSEPATIATINGSKTNAPQNTTTAANITNQPTVINKLSVLTNNKLPWITSGISFIMGGALVLLALKHSFGIKRSLRKGERFVVTHPMLDVLLVGIVLLGLLLSARVGIIL